jgi:hypothetical protein
MGVKSADDELERFLGQQPQWLQEYLRDGTLPEELGWALSKPGGADLICNAEDRYVQILRKYPAKLRAYRKRSSGDAKRRFLSMIPTAKSGAPRGMRADTLRDALELEKRIAEYIAKNGTKRGALDFAAKKVYGTGSDSRRRIELARQTLRRFKAQNKTVQKPTS